MGAQTGEVGGRNHFTDFDLDSREFSENFDDVVSAVHEGCPVAHSKANGGYWVVTGFDQIREIAQDWETFSNAQGYEPNRVGDDNARLYPLEIDPPYQTRWRAKLGSYFSPRSIRNNTEGIRGNVNALLDQFIEDGECDWIDRFAAHLPGRVFFSTMLGVPLADLSYLQGAADDAVRGPFEGRQEGWNKVGAYLSDYMLARKKEEPRGDFVDAILEGVETDDGEPAPWEHKVFVMVDMLAGGLATTTFLLAGLAHFLATRPEDRKRLIEYPALRPNALEEVVRYYASILALGRTATKDTEVAGQPIKKGEMVMLAFSAGARDPRIFPEPHTIDIERKISTNIAFGYGPHRCIGSHLARLQGLTAMEEMLRRMPDLRLADDSVPFYTHSTVTRDLNALNLVFTPGTKEGE
ncbi:MAG TPA: cytochrome P450 [Pseudonocardia sp.]|jgi:cytochrome P450|nr:cytochrome P450 [Pseudonocardia sp.]